MNSIDVILVCIISGRFNAVEGNVIKLYVYQQRLRAPRCDKRDLVTHQIYCIYYMIQVAVRINRILQRHNGFYLLHFCYGWENNICCLQGLLYSVQLVTPKAKNDCRPQQINKISTDRELLVYFSKHQNSKNLSIFPIVLISDIGQYDFVIE